MQVVGPMKPPNNCRNRSKVSPMRGNCLPKSGIFLPFWGPHSYPREPMGVKFPIAKCPLVMPNFTWIGTYNVNYGSLRGRLPVITEILILDKTVLAGNCTGGGGVHRSRGIVLWLVLLIINAVIGGYLRKVRWSITFYETQTKTIWYLFNIFVICVQPLNQSICTFWDSLITFEGIEQSASNLVQRCV